MGMRRADLMGCTAVGRESLGGAAGGTGRPIRETNDHLPEGRTHG